MFKKGNICCLKVKKVLQKKNRNAYKITEQEGVKSNADARIASAFISI